MSIYIIICMWSLCEQCEVCMIVTCVFPDADGPMSSVTSPLSRPCASLRTLSMLQAYRVLQCESVW